MRAGRTLGYLFGVAVLLAGVLVVAQPGGGVATQMRSRISETVWGTVVSADIANGVIEADKGSGWIVQFYPVKATRLLKKESMEAKDLQVGDLVRVVGAAVKIAARSITVDKATLRPEPTEDQPPWAPGHMRMLSFGGTASATVGGKVTAVAPLKIQALFPAPDELAMEVEVEVDIPPNAEVSRLADAAWEEVVKGVVFTAEASRSDNDPRWVLDELRLGDTPESNVIRGSSPVGHLRGPGGAP